MNLNNLEAEFTRQGHRRLWRLATFNPEVGAGNCDRIWLNIRTTLVLLVNRYLCTSF
ncbi:hypothetical protein CT19425_U610021 [Cupriavidus taiwanensis]|uniref:Uncharacterized protein n=1 Tax=Cupriavidus taiwanensis TaxID=164546 RepID=A0A375IBI7_9BURK|nr:hypothetical protein CT19425_U610021 [Cupriavidus taiwanensis]